MLPASSFSFSFRDGEGDRIERLVPHHLQDRFGSGNLDQGIGDLPRNLFKEVTEVVEVLHRDQVRYDSPSGLKPRGTEGEDLRHLAARSSNENPIRIRKVLQPRWRPLADSSNVSDSKSAHVSLDQFEILPILLNGEDPPLRT